MSAKSSECVTPSVKPDFSKSTVFVFMYMSAKGSEGLTHSVKPDYSKLPVYLSVSVPVFYTGIYMSVFNM